MGALVALGSPIASAAAPVEFARDIAPIFEQHCVSCHGAAKQKAALRLDVRKQSHYEEGLLVPGSPLKSELYKLLVTTDADERMPQGDGSKPLSEPELAKIAAWIEQGAIWPAGSDAKAVKLHWSYVAPIRPAIPGVKKKGWVKNPIDAFVLARLETEGMTPQTVASRETLLRRLHLDLIGLPPSPTEIDAFTRDRSPRAVENVVDALLSRPAYGERWARLWLDLARYADSDGFEKDGPRSMWPYRDWVVRAFNADLPFDQFTVEQIAGDMLPGATAEQKVATGFHANSMLNKEGGVDPDEARFEVLVDRVNTTASVWLGSTVGCAQCHNHKYDPISAKDYYRLMAFFDNIDVVHGNADGRNRPQSEPELRLPNAAQSVALKRIEAAIAEQKRTMEADTDEVRAAESVWVAQRRAMYQSFEPLVGKLKADGGARVTISRDNAYLIGGKNPPRDRYVLEARVAKDALSVLRLEALANPSLPELGPGRAPNGSFVVTRLQVFAAPVGDPKHKVEVTLSEPLDTAVNPTSPISAVLDKDSESGWAPGDTPGLSHMASFKMDVNGKPVGFPGGTLITVQIEQQSMHPQHQLGAFRVSVSANAEAVDVLKMPRAIRSFIQSPESGWSDDDRRVLREYFRETSQVFEAQRKAISAFKEEITALEVPTTHVMVEKINYDRPSTWLRERGAFTSPAEKVFANTPAILPALREDLPGNRLGLARWLVSKDNPLTARVMMNRIWETVFGRGIVATVEDFGTRGDPPSHPELLDWLAVEFVEQGYSFKTMLRTIVLSASYQQSSHVIPVALEKDPYNILVSRGPRFRVEAEMVRDLALAASGLLSNKIGGPPVMPPQPDGIWDVPYNNSKYRWNTATGPDRFRRGIYTFLRRSAPYPLMTTFDGTSREVCAVKRIRTNTPLQALNLLNDPAFVEIARGLGDRMVREGGKEVKGRLAYGFRLVTGRLPKQGETDRLARLFDSERQRFKNSGTASQLLAMTRAAEKPLPGQTLAVDEQAAYTLVANVLLNLDEMQTKE
jgi:mono/diheme cytochrome c family protein